MHVYKSKVYRLISLGMSLSRDSQLLGTGQFSRKLTVHRVPESDELHVHYISMEYGEPPFVELCTVQALVKSSHFKLYLSLLCTAVGLDVHEVFSPRYTGPAPLKRDTAGHSFQTRNGRGTPQSSSGQLRYTYVPLSLSHVLAV